jgi:hypothetical protein
VNFRAAIGARKLSYGAKNPTPPERVSPNGDEDYELPTDSRTT